MSAPPRLLDTILLWVLGAALYLAIALLPAVLMGAYFYDGVQTHRVVVPSVVVIYLLLWGAAALRPRTAAR